jgi:hypothetical protein
MSQLQKTIALTLLKGGSIAGTPAYGFRLRDSAGNVVAKFGYATWLRIRTLVKAKKGVYVISLRAVQQLHGKSFIKRAYRQLLKGRQQGACFPCFCAPQLLQVRRRVTPAAAPAEPTPQLSIF